jgi:hypothetical protein
MPPYSSEDTFLWHYVDSGVVGYDAMSLHM